MELVSVIIPTYKRSNYELERAIKSVMSQTYKNLEIIVIDDNANDVSERRKTREIIKKYNSVNYYENQKNLGGALSRNYGIQLANGKYIAFLDDDDEFLPEKIEKQLMLFKEKEKENKNIALVYCHKNIINSKGKIIWKSSNINYEGNCLFEQMKDLIETTSTWLCLKSALLSVGMFEDVKAHQDNILMTKILGAGYEIYRVPELLLNFYLHNGNGITKRDKNYLEYTKHLLEFKKQYYSRFNSKQMEEIRYYNSSLLMKIYYENGMKKEYFKEYFKVLKTNKFRKHTLRLTLNFFKIIFKREKNR